MAEHLEAELAEKPLVLARVVLLLEGALDNALGLPAGNGVLGELDLAEVGVEGIPRGQDVVVVDHLEEGLDTRAARHLRNETSVRRMVEMDKRKIA